MIAVLAMGNLVAQSNWCGFDAYYESMQSEMTPAQIEEMESTHMQEVQNSQFTAEQTGIVYTVPVVIHVLHDNCVGNISDEQIRDGLRIINEDFRRINADTSLTRAIFKPLAQDAEIQFKLATIDPDGNCTDGIVKYDTKDTYGADDNIKTAARRWPYNKYLNIWLVESIDLNGETSVLGYAKFPYRWGGSAYWNTYGLVVRSDQWGTIGTSSADGRTGTHEIGHCLGLAHTFNRTENGFCSNSSCTGENDGICDTPPQKEASWNCNRNSNTCSNDMVGGSSSNVNPFTSDVEDMIENYMSYNSCQNMYTQGQVNVMRSYFTNSNYPMLVNLVDSANLIATGTLPGSTPPLCEPKADYCQDLSTICEFATVTYIDRSGRGPVANRTWTFPGGTPSTSSDSIVTVTYENAGVYDVTLTVTNASGGESITRKNVVNVEPINANFDNWRYDEDFEDEMAYDTNWTEYNHSGSGVKWTRTDQASYNGNYSVFIRNHYGQAENVNELISPSFNLTSVESPQLTFKVAYARKSSNSFDFLRVYYTFDCGNNWNYLGFFASQFMESVPDFRTSEFIPANENEWRTLSLNFSSIAADKENVQIKFEFETGENGAIGNNIFIDDINIESLTGIEEVNALENIQVYPNPVKDILYIQLPQNEITLNSIVVRDLSGRAVETISASRISADSQGSIQLNVNNYVSGIYFVNITSSNGSTVTKKIVVN